MKQNFVYTCSTTPAAEQVFGLDHHDTLRKQLRYLLDHIAEALEHGEYYADPTRGMISGWRQQGVDPSQPGSWVEYDIKLRIGGGYDHSFGMPEVRAQAIVDDGIDQ